MYTQQLVLPLIALGATLSQAQFAGLPTCAGACIPKDLGGCGQINYDCICTNTALLSQLSCCVSQNCNQEDQDATIKFAQDICGSNANTSALPTTATCASSTASPSSSASSNGASSSSPSSQSVSTTGLAAAATSASGSASSTSSTAEAASTDNAASGLEAGVAAAAAVAGLLAAAL
ncbi:hypothetical protein K431DRAFT_309274 [Polychaeton citri CBS 116435]|uniref:CFEM domain-containing protein n=1 Tax=Polychaeton citri CBS 116435 TaxID=1314669 RepID=A0A9P4UUD1_9PEZI|nr:hypothetical protein K431DRAFT_309274 [Polychaeton citri CBS 116435]